MFRLKTMENLVKFVQDEFVTRKEVPEFKFGDTITVYYEIKEGQKQEPALEVVIQKEVRVLLKPLPLENVWYSCRAYLPN